MRKNSVTAKRIAFQIIGHIGLLFTVPKLFRWARELKRGPIEVWDGFQQAPIPMVDVNERREIYWAIEQLPADPARLPAPRKVTDHPALEPADAAGATPGSLRIPLRVSA